MQPSDAVEYPIPADTKPFNIREHGIQTRITAANAREMAQKSVEARRKRLHPDPVTPLEPAQTASPIASRVARLDERIEAVLDAMEKAKTAKDQQALAMAFRALNDVWSLLTGHPRAGVRKDKPRRSVQTFATPLE